MDEPKRRINITCFETLSGAGLLTGLLLVGIFNIYYIVKYAANSVFAERQTTVLGTAFQAPESRIVRNRGTSDRMIQACEQDSLP